MVGGGFFASLATSSFLTWWYVGGVATRKVKIESQPLAVPVFAVKGGGIFSEQDVLKVLERNIFNHEGKTAEDEEVGSQPAAEEKVDENGDSSVLTSLPLKLMGVIYGGDAFSGIAMIENTARRSISSFLVGDAVSAGVKVIEIYENRVILMNKDQREHLPLIEVKKEKKDRRRGRKGPASSEDKKIRRIAVSPPPEAYREEGFEREGTNIVVTDGFRRKLLGEDFSQVLQDAKAEPHYENGELAGFQVNRIRQDSIYEKAGLRNGDIVKEINGIPLSDAAQAIRLLQSLRGESQIEVRVHRSGESLNINLQVK